jgi:hypothetical protein
MDPESKRLLEDTFVLAKDNHRLLRAIRRHQLLSAYGKLLIWLILLISAALAYQTYLSQYVDQLLREGPSAFSSGGFDLSTTTLPGKLINSLKAGQ